MATKLFDDKAIEEFKSHNPAVAVDDLRLETKRVAVDSVLAGFKDKELYPVGKDAEVDTIIDSAAFDIKEIYDNKELSAKDKIDQINGKLKDLSLAKFADGSSVFTGKQVEVKYTGGMAGIGTIANASEMKKYLTSNETIDLTKLTDEITELTVQINTPGNEKEKEELRLRRDALSFVANVEMHNKLTLDYTSKLTKDSLVTSKNIKNIETIAEHRETYVNLMLDKENGLRGTTQVASIKDNEWYEKELDNIRNKREKYATMSDAERTTLDIKLQKESKYAQAGRDFYDAIIAHFVDDYTQVTDDSEVLQLSKDICDRIANGKLIREYIYGKLVENDGKILKTLVNKYGDEEIAKISAVNPDGTPRTKEDLLKVFPIPTKIEDFNIDKKAIRMTLPKKDKKDEAYEIDSKTKLLSKEYDAILEIGVLLPVISDEEFEELQKTITNSFVTFGEKALPKEFIELVKSKDDYVKNVEKCNAIIAARRDKASELLLDVVKFEMLEHISSELTGIPPKAELLTLDDYRKVVESRIISKMMPIPPMGESDKRKLNYLEREVLFTFIGMRNSAYHDKDIVELINNANTHNVSNIAMRLAQDKMLRDQLMIEEREAELMEEYGANPANAKLRVDEIYEANMNAHIIEASNILTGINALGKGTREQKLALAKLFVIDDKVPGYDASDPTTWIFKTATGPDGERHYIVNKEFPYATDKKSAFLIAAGCVRVAEAQGKLNQLAVAKAKVDALKPKSFKKQSLADYKEYRTQKAFVRKLEKELKDEYSAQKPKEKAPHGQKKPDWRATAMWTSPKAKMKFYEKLLKALNNYLANPVKVDIDVEKTKTVILTERDLAIKEMNEAAIKASAVKLMYAEEREFIADELDRYKNMLVPKFYDKEKGYIRLTATEIKAINAEPMDTSKLGRLIPLGVDISDAKAVKKYSADIGKYERLRATYKLEKYLTDPVKRQESYKDVLDTFIDDELKDLGLFRSKNKDAIREELTKDDIDVEKLCELTGKGKEELEYLVRTADRRNKLTGKEKAGEELEKEVAGIYDASKGTYIGPDGKINPQILTIALGLAGTTSADYIELAKDFAAVGIDLGKELDSGKTIEEVINSVEDKDLKNSIIEKHEHVIERMSLNPTLVKEEDLGKPRKKEPEKKEPEPKKEEKVEPKPEEIKDEPLPSEVITELKDELKVEERSKPIEITKPTKEATSKLAKRLEKDAIIDVSKELNKTSRAYDNNTQKAVALAPEEIRALMTSPVDETKLSPNTLDFMKSKGVNLADKDNVSNFLKEYRATRTAQELYDYVSVNDGLRAEDDVVNASRLEKGTDGVKEEELEGLFNEFAKEGIDLEEALSKSDMSIDGIIDDKISDPEVKERLKKRCKGLKQTMANNMGIEPTVETREETHVISKDSPDDPTM